MRVEKTLNALRAGAAGTARLGPEERDPPPPGRQQVCRDLSGGVDVVDADVVGSPLAGGVGVRTFAQEHQG